MKKDKKQNTLEEIFRKKMENHEVQADFSDWDIIRKRIPPKAARTKKWIFIRSSIAASITLFILSLYILDQTEELQNFSHYPDTNQQEEQIRPQKYTPSMAKQKNAIEETISRKQKDSFSLSEDRPLSTQTEHVPLIEINKDRQAETQDTSEAATETLENKNTDLNITDLYQQKNTFHTAIHKKASKKKHKQQWLLTSSLGTNTALPDKLQNPYTGNKNNLGQELWAGWGGGYYMDAAESDLIHNKVDVTHLFPFSFGLTIRKPLNSRFGVETGIIYTYLSSIYKWHEENNHEATQQLHYLGIPINGIITVWDNSRWSNYVSAGVTIEKGVQRKISKDNPQTILPSKLNQSKNIDGLQWSVSSSIGFNYHLSPKVSIYFEPRISYYFKNKQPRSVRTDSPVSAGFGMGVQYSL